MGRKKSAGPSGGCNCKWRHDVRANEAVSSARDPPPPHPPPSSPLSFLFLKPDLCSAESQVKVYRVRLDTASLHPSSLEVWKYSAPRPPPPFFSSPSSSPASFYPKLSVHFLINNHIRGRDLAVSTQDCLT